MQTRSQQEQKESEIERMRARLFEQSYLHREPLQQKDVEIERFQKKFLGTHGCGIGTLSKRILRTESPAEVNLRTHERGNGPTENRFAGKESHHPNSRHAGRNEHCQPNGTHTNPKKTYNGRN